MNDISIETCVDEVTIHQKMKTKEFLATYPATKSTREESVILTREGMTVSRSEPQSILEPSQGYFVVSRRFWQMVVKFLVSSRQERYQRKSLNMEEILLNPSLQKIAKAKKEHGEPYLFNLYTKFLKLASYSPVLPFGIDEKKDKNQFQMCKIALDILCYFFQTGSDTEQRKVAKDVQRIRSQPPRPPASGNICIVGIWGIIFLESILIGLSMIIPAFL